MTDDEVLALYERSIDDVYRYAMRLTGGDRSWADELAQETYLHLLRRVRRSDALEVDTGWLIVSCRHRFLDQLKRDRRRRDRERRVVKPEGLIEGDDGSVEALDGLPTDQRTVLVLRYVDELSVAEVAGLIGRSVHATESLLSRARAALRGAVVKGGQS